MTIGAGRAHAAIRWPGPQEEVCMPVFGPRPGQPGAAQPLFHWINGAPAAELGSDSSTCRFDIRVQTLAAAALDVKEAVDGGARRFLIVEIGQRAQAAQDQRADQ